ncbi:uncharacterized protein LOC143178526 [Calliopsis andreniformis]|uniref:uncharacterized protein LOC143178526 n=1 Tax=Calliopsis andreniformis TaxID=337506 RepID=UPI003FCED7C4
MLCCVSRRAVLGRDRGSYDHCTREVQSAAGDSGTVVEVEPCVEPDVPPILLPCAICARTFMPQSLEKHTRICEQSASKKRKIFDSAKQRIQGTELAEFLPRRRQHYTQEDKAKPKSTWKQNHDEFLLAIRAARSEVVKPPMQRQSNSVTSSAPSRANEQGVCPTCNRHFGIKAYDRHVAWCKERITRVPVSPATNIAKERLEARMKYRAPALRNRRQTTREKYSPGSAITLNTGNKTSPTTHRAKESVSAPNCNKSNDSPVKQKTPVVRRSGQTKESSPLGPMKSRAVDRTNRPPEAEPRPAPPERTSHLPVPPLKHKRESLEECISNPSPRNRPPRRAVERGRLDQLTSRVRQEDRHQASNSARSQKANIVSARSQGNPKVNDVSINAEAMGLTVKPCNIYRGTELTTWRKISQEKEHQTRGSLKAEDLIESTYHRDGGCIESPSKELLENDTLELASDVFKDDASGVSSRGSASWSAASKLNRTYSFKNSTRDALEEELIASQRKWKPVRHSPRIEFRLDDPDKVNRPQLSLSCFTSSIEFGMGDESRKMRGKMKHCVSENDVVGDCKEKNLDLGTLGKGYEGFESVKNKRLEIKGLRSAENSLRSDSGSMEDDKPRNASLHGDHDEDSAITELEDRLSAIESKHLLNCEDSEFKELEYSSEQKFQSLIYSEKCPYSLDDSVIAETCEQEIDQSVLSNDNRETNKIVDIKGSENNFDFNSDEKSPMEPFQDELPVSDKNEVFCNFEAQNDAFLVKDMLRPSRSSTPFNKIEHQKCQIEDSTEKSRFSLANCEWEMSIDEERGSQMMYRVEAKDSDYSHASDREEINELQETNFENENLELEHNSSNKLNESDNSIDVTPRVSHPVSPKEQKKDIASQINICNCSLMVSPSFKHEKTINESIERNSNLEETICDDSLKNRNSKRRHEVPEQSFETEATAIESVEKAEPNFKQNKSPKINSNTSLKETEPEERHVRQEDNHVDNTRKLFIKPSDEGEDEEVQEIYRNCSSKDFDEESDNTVEEQTLQDTVEDFKSPSAKNDTIDVRNFRSILLSESRVKLRKSTSRSTAFRSRKSRTLEMENKIHENMNQVESVEVETIEEIGTRNRSIRFRILPEIKKRSTVVVKEKYRGGEKLDAQTYWEKARKATKNRLISLDPPCQGASRFLKKNPKVCVLPPVPSSASLIRCRILKLPLRPVWSNYVRRRPDFNLVLSGRTGKDYDPFLLAEQQMNDLFSDASEQSVTDSPSRDQNRESSFPLSHSSAFVKYSHANADKHTSSLVPPSEFEDLTSDFSSDSTETNSLSREVFLKGSKEFKEHSKSEEKRSPVRELGRRVIIDKSKALGGDNVEDSNRGKSFIASTERTRKILDKVSPKVARPSINRSLSVRASSAPKTAPDRKTSNSPYDPNKAKDEPQRSSNTSFNGRNNNYVHLSSSNLSLSSIVSSDVDIKRSNSVFDELMTSFEDDNGPFPSLKSLLKNDSLSVSSPVHGRQRNDQISDEELSSPESYKRQDHSKLSGDSAYSSLNRKYSNHGRSTNDVGGRLDEDLPRTNRREGDGVAATTKCKMSKFCHECGSKFPETAKFCCECGIRRLVL